jgi:hypothetical protein
VATAGLSVPDHDGLSIAEGGVLEDQRSFALTTCFGQCVLEHGSPECASAREDGVYALILEGVSGIYNALQGCAAPRRGSCPWTILLREGCSLQSKTEGR